MSEVKRYHVVSGRLCEGVPLGMIGVVLVADFDRVTAERDALQQLLTAADDRADVLERALNRIIYRCRAFIEDDACMSDVSLEALIGIARAALKPAEVHRNQCDGCQAGIPVVNGAHRMGKPGGYPDTLGCTAKLYKP